ncbi:MAG TPA: pyridine nucleotide-disulfide oxidoreductase [Gammaproteobacteria bacterium]|nr:pyridine nucleotide-disulfide oxidoreductase [Gammaproteobacteria bacterium]
MKKGLNSRSLVVLIVVLLIAAFFVFDLGQYLTLDYIKSQRQSFLDFYAQNRFATLAIYFAIYVAVTALSLPGATVMTLAGGAVFGLATGLLLISFASTIGATLAFVISRFVLRDTVQSRFRDKLKAINAGVEKEGDFYLFTLRLIPLFPFFVINLVMGLTPMKTWRFYLVSQIGMLPGTAVFVNAGSQLGALESASGILSPGLILSFALLGVFPLLAKKLVSFIKSRKILKQYPKPKSFDYNIVVIGGGSAGLVSAYIAAAVKAKVLLIEKHKMGGDCLNTGCVPSKALIRSAKMLHYAKRAEDFGFRKTTVEFEFSEIMERVQHVIKQIEPHDSVERYTKLGVEVIQSEAKIISPYEVEVEGKTVTAKNIVVATGARPAVPPIPGLEAVGYLTSDTVWHLREHPRRLVVLGGGPIGCELAQSFQRLGSNVTLIQRGAQLLPREDTEIAKMVETRFNEDGIDVRTGHAALRFEMSDGQRVLICKHKGAEVRIEFDQLLLALGRKANVQGFGLEDLNVGIAAQGTIEADEFLRTNYPNIYVCGDVTGPYQFTHTAAHQAWYVAVNALFSPFKRFRVDYSVIPWATFTDPEVARVGLNELEAKEKNIAYEVSTYGIDDLDRAIADSEAHGLVKVLTMPGKDKILGVTIVGNHAGDLIAEFVMAMKHGLGLNKILSTIHIYPTMAESNKYVAGVWKRQHKPEALLRWVARFHTWRRGSP